MGSGIRRYLMVAVTFGAPFGLIVGLIAGVVVGPWTGVLAGLGLTVAAGGLFACTLLVVEILRRRDTGTALGSSPRQRLELHSRAPADVLADALRGAVAALPARVERDALPRGPLIARTTVSLWSFGERVTVAIRPSSGGHTVELRSDPVVRTTLLDYGSAARNVRALATAVERV